MTFQEILNERNEKGMIVIDNESANWFGISRDGYHMITFGDDNKFYKNEKSWAIRISQLLRRGF